MAQKDLGMVTSYAYAVSKGYTGTEEEFAEGVLASAEYADNAQASATEASGYAQDANTAKTQAQNAASSVQASATQIATNTADIADIKSDLSEETTARETLEADVEQNYAKIDGYYENLTSGSTEQLISTVTVEDKVPYQFRTSGGSADIGNRETDKIVGGTVAWNQLANFSILPSSANGITYTSSDGKSVTFNGTASAVEQRGGWFGISETQLSSKVGHKLVFIPRIISGSVSNGGVYCAFLGGSWKTFNDATIKAVETSQSSQRLATKVESGAVVDNYKVSFIVVDLTQALGTTIADYIYSLEQATAGAGVAFFRKLFPKPYYAYNAGELKHVEGLTSHDTTGFNQWDEEWESGAISTTTGAKVDNVGYFRSKNYIPLLPNTQYYFKIPSAYSDYGRMAYYDADKNFVKYVGTANLRNAVFTTDSNVAYAMFWTGEKEYASTGKAPTYKHDICVNLSWDGERDGEYEAYVKHSYPLDDSLVLRGIPKLDSNNQLYYDGDIYASNGTVTRKYAHFAVTSSTTVTDKLEGTNGIRYSITEPEVHGTLSNIMSNKFEHSNDVLSSGLWKPGQMRQYSTATKTLMVIVPSQYNTNALAKQYLIDIGAEFVYELATPTEETADPYTGLQIVDSWGTEEYVTDSIVPVGHVTQYPVDLKAKVEASPNAPSDNGDYIVRHANGENTYVPLIIPTELPTAPGVNGTYVLKVTVANGEATYSWVSG